MGAEARPRSFRNQPVKKRRRGESPAEEIFDISDQPARWLRHVGHGNTDATKGTWNSVSEASVLAVPWPSMPTVR